MLLFHPTIFTYPPSDNRDSYRFSLLLRLIYPLHQAGEPDVGVHDNSFLKQLNTEHLSALLSVSFVGICSLRRIFLDVMAVHQFLCIID